jgi:hypothetical protein
VIIDSCKSGALLAAKGGKPGSGFQIRLSDNVASNGEALLTSSAANELALESREIRGSFFTHHLVSGLRGAADLSGDGRVTLSEAYQYAFARTVSATAATILGPQHPAYDYRLAGEGDLVLATLSRPNAAIEVPQGFDRVLVIQVARDLVIAEIPRGAPGLVAVAPGPYTVRAWRNGRVYTQTIDVRAGETHTVRGDELAPIELAATATKGDLAARSDPTPSVLVAGGAQGAASSTAGPLRSLFVAVRSGQPHGWSMALDVASGRGSGYRETSATVLGGHFVGIARGVLHADLGIHAGLGLVTQHRDSGGMLTSPTVTAVPWLDISLRVTDRTSLAVEGGVATSWLRRDGANAIVFGAVGFAGVAVHF